MNRAKISVIILSIVLLSVCTIGTARLFVGTEETAYGGSIYDLLSPDIIEIYEREISLCPVVSDTSAAMIERTAKTLGISEAKLKTVMLIQDLASRLDEDISLSRLAEMSDIELFIYAKDRGTAYANTLSPERREELKSLLLSALKS